MSEQTDGKRTSSLKKTRSAKPKESTRGTRPFDPAGKKRKDVRPFASVNLPSKDGGGYKGFARSSTAQDLDVLGSSTSGGGAGIFYLPAGAPSSPSSSRIGTQESKQTSSKGGLGDVETSVVRQSLIALQRRIESGGLKGVQLELMDISACRCITLCRPEEWSRPDIFDPSRVFMGKDQDDLTVRVLITFSFKSTDTHKIAVPHFALVPRTLQRSQRLQELMDGLKKSLHEFSSRWTPNQAETVLKYVVRQLTTMDRQSLHGIPNDESGENEDKKTKASSAIFSMDMIDGQGQHASSSSIFHPKKTLSRANLSSSSGNSAFGERNLIGHGRKASSSSLISNLQTSAPASTGTPGRGAQPCPRFAGASFSGPGLLVYFNSGIGNQLQARRLQESQEGHSTSRSPGNSTVDSTPPHLGGTFASPQHSAQQQQQRDSHYDIHFSNNNDRRIPRTYDELLGLLTTSKMPSLGLKKTSSFQSEDDDSLYLSRPWIRASYPFEAKNSIEDDGDVGITEELTINDLFDWNLRNPHRLKTVTGDQDPTGPLNGTGLHTVEEEEEEDGASPTGRLGSLKVQVNGYVVLLDTSLLSPIHRYLGRALRLGPLAGSDTALMDIFSRLENRHIDHIIRADGKGDGGSHDDKSSSSTSSAPNQMQYHEPTRKRVIRHFSTGPRIVPLTQQAQCFEAYLSDSTGEDSLGLEEDGFDSDCSGSYNDGLHVLSRGKLRAIHGSFYGQDFFLDGDDSGEDESLDSMGSYSHGAGISEGFGGYDADGLFPRRRDEIEPLNGEDDDKGDDDDDDDDDDDRISEPDSYESLLCWYDDFSDEPVHSWDHLPVGIGNMYASRTIGRFDLVHAWQSLCVVNNLRIASYETILNEISAGNKDSPSVLSSVWAIHPCGRKFLEGLFKEYARLKDVQTLAIVSCILQDEAECTTWRKTVPLLDEKWRLACDRHRRAYANILHQWGLNTRRAEVMKYVSRLPEEVEEDKLAVAPVCPSCREASTDISCQKQACKAKGTWLQCSVCQVAVRGLCTFCPACGHGGHASHMNEWFASSEECPTGCGCLCGQEI